MVNLLSKKVDKKVDKKKESFLRSLNSKQTTFSKM